MSPPDSTQTAAPSKPAFVLPARPFLLRDLPFPPELQTALDEDVRRFWWWERRSIRRGKEEDYKFAHYFAGTLIAMKRTPEGPLVLAVGDDEVNALRERCTPGERATILIWRPFALSDGEPFPGDL